MAQSAHVAHGRTWAGIAERLAQLVDERQQLAGRGGVGLGVPPVGGARLGGVAREVRRPVGVTDDPGGPADALPPGRRDHPAVGAPCRHVAEQRHQRRAAQAAPVELEQLAEHPRHHPLADGGAGPTVPRDAGRRQLVLDEPGVRPVGREQHGDAVEPRAGPGGVDDGPHGDADLVVGVGGGDHGDEPDRRDDPVDARR